MRHLPFFTELASLDESDARWRAVSAGLVVLRLVDAWLEEGARAVAADGWGVRSVQAAIEEMQPGTPARAILSSVVQCLTDSACGDMHTVAPRLMAYARSLDADAHWTLAADVYETVIAHVHPLEDSDSAINAHVRLSYCLRMLGELDNAEQIAIQAGRIAHSADNLIGTLQARLAESKVSIMRGNYPRAEEMLEETIARAEQAQLEPYRAHAMQERADVAYLKGEYEYAIRLGYDALKSMTDERARDRLLSDIAGAFYKLGIRSAARDAYTVLSVTAQEQYVRWTASINLMEIAADDGSRPLFERQRRDLDAAPLPPLLRAQLLIHAGEGLSRFGDTVAARRNLSEAVEYASQYDFHRLVFHAEEQLRNLSETAYTPAAEPEMPESLITIAHSIRERQIAATSA